MNDDNDQPTGLDSALALEAGNQVDYFQVAAALEKQLAAVEAENDRLKEWRDSVSSAIKQIPGFATGEWGGDKDGWGYHFEIVRWITKSYADLIASLTDSEAKCEKYRLAASVLCAAHIGVTQPACPVCELGRIQTGLLDEIGRWRQMRDERDEAQEISDGRLEALLEKTEEGHREWIRAEQAETDRNHAIATLVSATASLADAGFKGETVREQVASVVARVAGLESDLLAERRAHGSTQVNLKIATAQLEEAEHHAKRYSIEYDSAKADVDEAKADNARLRQQFDKWKHRTKLFQEAYKEKDMAAFILGLQKGQLEALGTDAILIKQRDSLKVKYLEACKERNALRQQVREIGERVKAECLMRAENAALHYQSFSQAIKSVDVAACGAKAEGDNYNE